MVINKLGQQYICSIKIQGQTYSGAGYSVLGAMSEAIKLYEFFK
jgi:hypothetical protein